MTTEQNEQKCDCGRGHNYWEGFSCKPLENEDECICGNEAFGLDCVCEHVEKFKGEKEYCCEFCGIYVADKPRCNKCEEWGQDEK